MLQASIKDIGSFGLAWLACMHANKFNIHAECIGLAHPTAM
jgi:hypothetical protein